MKGPSSAIQSMVSFRRAIVSIGVWAVLTMSSAVAHHSYSIYDRDNPVRIEGELVAFKWRNPHVILKVKPAGEAPYRVEWFAVHRVSRAGVHADSLEPGDHVIVRGSRHPEDRYRILTLVREVTRPSDGWSWTRPKYGAGTLRRPGDSG